LNKNLLVNTNRGDLKAIERAAYEICQAAAEAGVIYSEVHYTPHFYLPDRPATVIRYQDNYRAYSHSGVSSNKQMTVNDVVEAVNRGIDRGQRQFNIAVRSILILIRTKPEWSMELIQLAIQYKKCGVVGLDIFGDIIGATSLPNEAQVINGTSQNDFV